MRVHKRFGRCDFKTDPLSYKTSFLLSQANSEKNHLLCYDGNYIHCLLMYPRMGFNCKRLLITIANSPLKLQSVEA